MRVAASFRRAGAWPAICNVICVWRQGARDVTADDIQRLANAYFDDARRVEGIIRGTGRLSGG